MAVRWFSMSTQFLTDPKVEDLGEKHGPGGPLVIVALLGRAKIADDAGRVTCSYRTLGNEAFCTRDEARAIVLDAVSSGLIEMVDGSESEASVCFPAYRRWQDAGRKAKEREDRKPAHKANVRTRPEVSGPVPTDKTRHDKTDKTDREVGKADAPLSNLLADLIEGNGAKRPTVTGKWADAERLMVDRDGRDRGEAERLVRWCQSDEFWRGNVLSMPKFREKYDQLLLQAKRAKRSCAPGMSQAEERARAIQRKREARAA